MRKARGVDAWSFAVNSLVVSASVWPFRHCRAWGWVATVLVGSFLPWSWRCSNWKAQMCCSGRPG